MRYMIVEHFRNGDPVPVYARFRASGRLAPDGLAYVDSWVTEDLRRCYQIMECDNPSCCNSGFEHGMTSSSSKFAPSSRPPKQ